MFLSPRCVRNILIALSVVVCPNISVYAQDTMKVWEEFDFSRTALKQSQVQALPLDELKLLRGVVFGRHGRIFKGRRDQILP